MRPPPVWLDGIGGMAAICSVTVDERQLIVCLVCVTGVYNTPSAKSSVKCARSARKWTSLDFDPMTACRADC